MSIEYWWNDNFEERDESGELWWSGGEKNLYEELFGSLSGNLFGGMDKSDDRNKDVSASKDDEMRTTVEELLNLWDGKAERKEKKEEICSMIEIYRQDLWLDKIFSQITKFFVGVKNHSEYIIQPSDISMYCLQQVIQKKISHIDESFISWLYELQNFYDNSDPQEQWFIKKTIKLNLTHQWFDMGQYTYSVVWLISLWRQHDKETKDLIFDLVYDHLRTSKTGEKSNLYAIEQHLTSLIPQLASLDDENKEHVITLWKDQIRWSDNEFVYESLSGYRDLEHHINMKTITQAQLLMCMFDDNIDIAHCARTYIKHHVYGDIKIDLPLSQNELGLLQLQKEWYQSEVFADDHHGKELLSMIEGDKISLVLRHIIDHYKGIQVEGNFRGREVLKSIIFDDNERITCYQLPLSDLAIQNWSSAKKSIQTKKLIWYDNIKVLCKSFEWFEEDEFLISLLEKSESEKKSWEDYSEKDYCKDDASQHSLHSVHISSELETIIEQFAMTEKHYGITHEKKDIWWNQQRELLNLVCRIATHPDYHEEIFMNTNDGILTVEKHYKPLTWTLSNNLATLPSTQSKEIPSDWYYHVLQTILKRLPD